MDSRLLFDIAAQPDNTTCGPTCLHAVYRHYGDILPLEQVILEAPSLEQGGTLAVMLGCHALQRGYRTTIYTFNLQVFDPVWFRPDAPPLEERLQAQMDVKDSRRLRTASLAYLEYLRLGGSIRMQDLTADLLRRTLKKNQPILTGLSATYLYNEPRECGEPSIPDDIRGQPQGHFVVLWDYDRERREVRIADPLRPNPMAQHKQQYEVGLDRLMCAIMLGIVTYDANLLIIEPRPSRDAAASRDDSSPLSPPTTDSLR